MSELFSVFGQEGDMYEVVYVVYYMEVSSLLFHRLFKIIHSFAILCKFGVGLGPHLL